MRRPTSTYTRLFYLGSCLAAVTACGRRVDSSEREDNTTRSTATDVANRAAPKAGGTELSEPTTTDTAKPIRLTASELTKLVNRARRQGTLINVWATWCGPCREELPMLAKVNRSYASKGLAVLPLSVDEPEQEGKIAALLEGYGFAGPYYVAARPLDELKRSLSETWPGNIPVSFLLDGSAQRRFFWTAQVYENELVPKLELLLQGKLDQGQANFAVAPGKTL